MQLHTYLFFDGDCEAAFQRYSECLGGTIEGPHRYGDGPDSERFDAAQRNRVMHITLRIGDQMLMGSDCMPPDHPYQGSNGYAVSISIDDVARGERIFETLAEGGSIGMPMQQTFWVERFGMVTDRHGIHWMLSCGACAQPPQ